MLAGHLWLAAQPWSVWLRLAAVASHSGWLGVPSAEDAAAVQTGHGNAHAIVHSPSHHAHYGHAPPVLKSNSVLIALLVLGLVTVCCATAALKMVLDLRAAAARDPPPEQVHPLDLPPRLLLLAKQAQWRNPQGLGILGLKQRTPSKRLAELAYPLMNEHHVVPEADENGSSRNSSGPGSPLMRLRQSRAEQARRGEGGTGNSSSDDDERDTALTHARVDIGDAPGDANQRTAEAERAGEGTRRHGGVVSWLAEALASFRQ
jgi:hypothetical protein